MYNVALASRTLAWVCELGGPDWKPLCGEKPMQLQPHLLQPYRHSSELSKTRAGHQRQSSFSSMSHLAPLESFWFMYFKEGQKEANHFGGPFCGSSFWFSLGSTRAASKLISWPTHPNPPRRRECWPQLVCGDAKMSLSAFRIWVLQLRTQNTARFVALVLQVWGWWYLPHFWANSQEKLFLSWRRKQKQKHEAPPFASIPFWLPTGFLPVSGRRLHHQPRLFLSSSGPSAPFDDPTNLQRSRANQSHGWNRHAAPTFFCFCL